MPKLRVHICLHKSYALKTMRLQIMYLLTVQTLPLHSLPFIYFIKLAEDKTGIVHKSVGGRQVTTRLLAVERESLLCGSLCRLPPSQIQRKLWLSIVADAGSLPHPPYALRRNPSQFSLWLLWFVKWNLSNQEKQQT